jgi:hypothetical protein
LTAFVKDDLLGLLPDPCEVAVFGWIALHRRIPVGHRLIESPPGQRSPVLVGIEEKIFMAGAVFAWA